MPKCEICGKELKNPKSATHLKSKYHLQRQNQKSNKGLNVKTTIKKNEKSELSEIKSHLIRLEKRIDGIEKRMGIAKPSLKRKTRKFKVDIFKDDNEFYQEIIKIISQISSFKHVKGNFALKDLRKTFLKEYKISDIEFEEHILRLYRKQIIDLQPGGKSSDYHLLSPTGKKFYYFIIKQ